jgi:hypothetical protein
MAITTAISQAELARLAAAAYEGLPYRICLALNGTNAFTANSPLTSWDGVERSGNGYARVEGFIEPGTYNETNLRYQMPQITAEFQASGGTLTYDTVYVVIDDGYTETLHSIIVETPQITLVDGASVIYRVTLATDD